MKMLKNAHSLERRSDVVFSDTASVATAANPKLVSCKATLIKLKCKKAVRVPL